MGGPTNAASKRSGEVEGSCAGAPPGNEAARGDNETANGLATSKSAVETSGKTDGESGASKTPGSEDDTSVSTAAGACEPPGAATPKGASNHRIGEAEAAASEAAAVLDLMASATAGPTPK